MKAIGVILLLVSASFLIQGLYMMTITENYDIPGIWSAWVHIGNLGACRIGFMIFGGIGMIGGIGMLLKDNPSKQ